MVDNGAKSKFDDVLLEHGGLPHVFPLATCFPPGLETPSQHSLVLRAPIVY